MGPGLSAFIRLTLPSPSFGISASSRTRTPMPPSHCVSARQSWMPRGSEAGAPKMEAPVVVKPETVSNSAST